jgi:hypothetical protein
VHCLLHAHQVVIDGGAPRAWIGGQAAIEQDVGQGREHGARRAVKRRRGACGRLQPGNGTRGAGQRERRAGAKVKQSSAVHRGSVAPRTAPAIEVDD